MIMTKKTFAFIMAGILILAGLTLITNQRLPRQNDDRKISIVTSFYPLYFFTSQIATGAAEIYNLTPNGVEPHDYELTPKDMAKIYDSELLIINGSGVEPWAQKTELNLKDRPNKILTVGDNLIVNGDPHIWLSPKLAQMEVQKITAALIAIDRTNTQLYQNNSQTLQKKLENLDQQYQTELSRCTKKNIITSHDAFGYLANDYHLNQISIAGLSPEVEPSAQRLAEIADYAKKNQVQYIFFESLVSPKLAQTIAREIGAKTLVLNPIEGLNDEEITSGQDYFTKMQQNLTNLKVALTCQ
jgi:zinc transport system substrate-binding protein